MEMVRDTLREAFGLTDGEDEQHGPDISHPPNQVFDLLSARRRRIGLRVVAALDDGETMSQKQFAREIAAVELDSTPEMVASNEYKSVYNALLQFHLEKMVAADVVSWAERAKEVGRASETEDVARLLEEIEACCADYQEPE